MFQSAYNGIPWWTEPVLMIMGFIVFVAVVWGIFR